MNQMGMNNMGMGGMIGMPMNIQNLGMGGMMGMPMNMDNMGMGMNMNMNMNGMNGMNGMMGMNNINQNMTGMNNAANESWLQGYNTSNNGLNNIEPGNKKITCVFNTTTGGKKPIIILIDYGKTVNELIKLYFAGKHDPNKFGSIRFVSTIIIE